MPNIKLSKRTLTSLPKVDKPTVFYDTDLTGFGLKAFPSGALSWIVEYRPGAGGRGVSKRRMVLGSAKNIAPEEARNRAAGILAEVRLGGDPAANRSEARAAENVRDLLTSFMDNHVRTKRKARTAKLFDGYINNHIVPALGTKKAPTLTRADVERLHKAIGKTNPVTANRVLALIGAVYAYGLRSKLLPHRTDNPAKGIEKFPERMRERFLSDVESARLGDAIRQAETGGIPRPASNQKHAPKTPIKIGPHAAAAIRLLIFTGARLREILDLRWEDVDLQRGLLFLQDSKTGKKTIVLGGAALAILETLPRVGQFVIAGNHDDKPRSDLQKPWALVSKQAGLAGLRLHDLRHSFASVGAGSGLGLPIIGKLLGHTNSKTTERYAHLAADPLRRATDAISSAIAKAMGEKAA
jgi:integrase